jgi:hypothetical protein
MKKLLLLGLVLGASILSAFSALADEESVRKDISPVLEADKAQLLTWLKGLTGLNRKHLILLDVTSKAQFQVLQTEMYGVGKYLVAINVVYAIDKGYGYSMGPFGGTLSLFPTENGDLQWLSLTGPTPEWGDYYSDYIQRIINRGEIARALGPGANVDEFIAAVKKAKQEAGLK